MPTVLSFLSGRQITDANGDPASGAKLYHYEAGTTTLLTIYQDSAGDTPHANPVVCDVGGFVPLVYISDASDWKVLIATSADVTLRTYDDLPAAPADESGTGFAPPLYEWTQVTSSASPVALTAADAGKAYEADTTGGNIEFDLPSAASVGNGKGFLFKKTASANTLTIDPNASETVDDSATSLSIARQYQVTAIVSNGAEWYVAFSYLETIAGDRVDIGSDTVRGTLEIAVQAELEAASSNVLAVPPGRMRFHPGVAKCWAVVTYSAGTPSLTTSLNITSITDDGVGVLTITIATDFSSADWVASVATQRSADATTVTVTDQAAGTVQLSFDAPGSGNFDPTKALFAGFGDQA